MTVRTELDPRPAEALERALTYPRLRYMGNKHRLLPWLHDELSGLHFDSALDAFAGSGCVSYLLKCMGKRVVSNDFLRLGQTLTQALVVNGSQRVTRGDLSRLARETPGRPRFIEETFDGIFYRREDLVFLDRTWAALDGVAAGRRALVLAALARAALKRQPRAVFTVAGSEDRYQDGRRDLRLSLEDHFHESVELLNPLVFGDGHRHSSHCVDVFELPDPGVDLVYLDPPYVPRSDDNCYVKRYHFIEGLMSYWRAPEARIMWTSKVRKLEKRYSDFSYRRTAVDAFDRLFARFASSTIVLSYSSNGWPDLDVLVDLMRAHKKRVTVRSRPHRYSFGTHARVAANRAVVEEYLIVGR